ncbi:hypothetical protein LOTGIDRAFT_160424 [Lottia gigantea]|uniref:Uncharacterized protein n=1 Tax=Lottia gigantea TaxID=225164 RepID=V4C1F5_LOTGI|nr:hypothetical protein LOTGIDRAFT_160424 [Lottia gigantea]ESO95304.1 hypothetical protein LOTGIDRAFT_160424 [Lottia gigantea]
MRGQIAISLLILGQVLIDCSALPHNDGLISKVLSAVEKEANFFARDFSDLNVDGLYGLRVGEGQIKEAVNLCREKNCGEVFTERLFRLLSVVAKTGENAMPYIKEDDPEYFERFRSVIDKPYMLEYKPHHFENLDDVKLGTETQYDEEFGDMCYARLMGSYASQVPKCNVTDECWDFMTQENTRAYFITHQLLYFILSQHLGCKNAFEKYESSEKPGEVLNRFCKHIYKESTNLENNQQVAENQQDLFLEQSLLCGTLGFEDFERKDWMNMVLKWQRSDGCFGMSPTNYLKDLERIIKTSGGRRKLLRESSMKDGCLSHKSGLGFGVLSVYLRYLVEKL